MFFILSKLLAIFISPLSWILAVLISSIIWRKHQTMLLRIGVALLLLLTNPFLARTALKWWEVEPTPYVEIQEEYELAVVLTGMVDLQGTPKDRIHFGETVDRINHTIDLYKKGIVQRILISGGTGSLLKPELREAPLLKAYCASQGIPEQHILIDSDSRNTYENARNSTALINEQFDGTRFLLITSAFHMRRSIACFEKQGVHFHTFATDYMTKPTEGQLDRIIIPSVEYIRIWGILIKEWVGMLAYKFAGYI